MKNPLQGKQILLGVTGSIACYKAADLASKLAQSGALVDVVLTPSAIQFVAPLTFQSVTGRRAYTDSDLWGSEGHVQHIGLAKAADLLVVAPASANTIARLAHGLADNLLCLTALAATCPLLVAPAMDGGMFAHPATQENLEILRKRGAIIIGPTEGHLASGMAGVGRMLEPVDLLGTIRLELSQAGVLQGRRVIVTAGGTQEPLDPVRTITNRSSGKQGFALAQAAVDLGAQVTLITAPTPLATPTGVQRLEVRTAQDMLEAVMDALPQADVLLMAAAVADFRPSQSAPHKIKRDRGLPEIKLETTPDILAEVASTRQRTGQPRVIVGFAAESQHLLDNARRKLSARSLDMIVANDISRPDSGFEADTNCVTLLYPDGKVESLPLLTKFDVAQEVMQRVVRLLNTKGD